MNKTCTLEQAKRLKELGVEQKAERYFMESSALSNGIIDTIFECNYAAFDTDELLAMLPDTWLISWSRGKYRIYTPKLEFSGYSGDTPSEALADTVIDMCQCENKGFTVAEINERIKQYNNA